MSEQRDVQPSTSKRGAEDEIQMSGTKRLADGDQEKVRKRASQACLLCRKRKLRCLGGWPCKRCTDSHNVCDFGQGALNRSHDQVDKDGGAKAYARLEQLESSVAHLLAGLSQPPESIRMSFDGSQHVRPSKNAWSPPDSVRFDPNVVHVSPISQNSHQMSNSTPTALRPSPNDNRSSSSCERSQHRGPNAEERLAVATKDDFDPPFKALVYHPSVWDNREASRRNSPERTHPPSRDEPTAAGMYDRRYGRNSDDPINTGIINAAMAEVLYGFFIDHCHPFMPIIDVTVENPFDAIRKHPPLISAICGISARFYNRFYPTSPLEPSTPIKLANLAMFHLSQTLLRKQHTLSDVQMILLLAAWCLMGEGGGGDAWVMSGHAVRLMRRLGLHTILAAVDRTAKPGTKEWTALEQTMPQWRTWLCWLSFDGLFSLGFGRPQTAHVENFDEQVLLQIRLKQPLPRPGSCRSVALHGDLYIAGQVQLTHIGRDLRIWVERLAEGGKDAVEMFRELNLRLDEWSKLWVWSSSPHAIYLGSSVALSRLQGEHMRLCLNSYALRYSPDVDDFIAECLKKAFNAAISTIQSHHESSHADFALSFATDYMTITIAQAALFLIRMTRAPSSVQAVVSLDSGVITHYLNMVVESLESGDISETRLGTYLARTIRDIASVAGLGPPGVATSGTTVASEAAFDPIINESLGTFNMDIEQPDELGFGFAFGNEQRFDIDNFLQSEAYSDLGYLLGLPGQFLPDQQQQQ